MLKLTEQCRKAIEIDPQGSDSHLPPDSGAPSNRQSKRDTGALKRLATLRQQATNEEREQYRYKLVEGDTDSK